MNIAFTYFIIPLISALVGGLSVWVGKLFLSKKEKQKIETELISETISSMLGTIDNVMAKYSEVQQELIVKSEMLLRKEIENSELLIKIEELEKAINRLQREVSKLTKNSIN